ncbi:MAG: hypothetical protein PVG07_10860 [Acidobacteriota bacterium]|jgi:hypothetical protein
MKQLTYATLMVLIAALGLAGCSEDAGDVDGGGIELVISDFDGLPTVVGMEQAAAIDLVTIGEITLQSIVKDPSQGSSDLQTVRLRRYEVVYTRADGGETVPTPLVEGLIGTVPVNGETTIDNLPIMRSEQIENPPLSNLLLVNGGFDRDTGNTTIRLNLRLRFFGETVGGRNLASQPQDFTVEFRPSL